MRKRAVVLGCGLVGATMARDMAADPAFDVRVLDASKENLARVAGTPNLRTTAADLGSPAQVRAAIEDADVVLGAMPSALGYMVLRSVIDAGKPFADISFMPQDALELDDLAKQKNTTAVVDCGVAPGLANLVIGHCDAKLDRTERVWICVGGLPKRPQPPLYYKAPFAPSDVMEEYVRPARMKENGVLVTKPALSDPEFIDFPGVGRLEAFNTDGLRSLLRTIDAPHMREKTLRWPGHRAIMEALREMGWFGEDEIEVGGRRVRPRDVTARLLFPVWRLAPGEEEFTILHVIVQGRRGGREVRYTYDLYDEYDAATAQTSMARTTGFPCAIVARLLARGEIAERGVLPPERLGRIPGVLERFVSQLAERGVELRGREEAL